MQPISHRRTEAQTPPSLWQVIASVAAAFFGVQNRRNRERDFTRGRPAHYIVMGLLMTGLVALCFYGAVQLALRLGGVH